MRRRLTAIVTALVLGAGLMTVPAVADDRIVYVDTCSEVRTFFREARPAFLEERQKRITQMNTINKRLGVVGDRRLVRRNADRETRAEFMDYLEQVAAMGWPTATDRRLRSLLKSISDGKRIRNNTLSLGRYCRAGTYVGISGR